MTVLGIYFIGLVITYFTSGLLLGWRIRRKKLERKTDKEVKHMLFWAIVFWFISVPVLIVIVIIGIIVKFWKFMAAVE